RRRRRGRARRLGPDVVSTGAFARQREDEKNDGGSSEPHGGAAYPKLGYASRRMGFPVIRPRRLRATPEIRALVRETRLAPDDFVYPMFFSAAIDAPKPVGTMPGVDQLPTSVARE